MDEFDYMKMDTEILKHKEVTMKITEVRVRLSESEGSLKAFADITIENALVVKGLKVMTGRNGDFVSMPSRKMPNGEYKDQVFALNKEFRQNIQESVLAEYNKLNKSNNPNSSDSDNFEFPFGD